MKRFGSVGVAAAILLVAGDVCASEPALALPKKLVVEASTHPEAVYVLTVSVESNTPYLTVTCNGEPYVSGAARQAASPHIPFWDGSAPTTVVGADLGLWWPKRCEGAEVSVELHVRRDGWLKSGPKIETWTVDFYEGEIGVEPPFSFMESEGRSIEDEAL